MCKSIGDVDFITHKNCCVEHLNIKSFTQKINHLETSNHWTYISPVFKTMTFKVNLILAVIIALSISASNCDKSNPYKIDVKHRFNHFKTLLEKYMKRQVLKDNVLTLTASEDEKQIYAELKFGSEYCTMKYSDFGDSHKHEVSCRQRW